jgi:hypothetical protein
MRGVLIVIKRILCWLMSHDLDLNDRKYHVITEEGAQVARYEKAFCKCCQRYIKL